MIEWLSKHIFAAIVFSKMCRTCKLKEENGEEPPDHVYPKNYDGSSKTMEVDAALHLYKIIYITANKTLYVKAIVGDDDSSMRALLKHRRHNWKGRLPTDTPEPEWLADPSRRTKVVANFSKMLMHAPR